MHGPSLVADSRGYCSLWCAGFLLQRFLLLQTTSSGHTGFSSSGEQDLLPHSTQDLPGPGIEPTSPALAGRFLSIREVLEIVLSLPLWFVCLILIFLAM